MASNITDDPEYWQKRAEEARTLAEQMMDTHTKSLMLGIANHGGSRGRLVASPS